MSAAGVVHISTVDEAGKTLDPPRSEFLPLSSWLRELSAYNMMRQLPLFKTYLPRKMLRIWRNAAHARIYGRARTAIQERLFFAKPAFVTLLMDATRLLHTALSCPLMPFTGPKMVRLPQVVDTDRPSPVCQGLSETLLAPERQT